MLSQEGRHLLTSILEILVARAADPIPPELEEPCQDCDDETTEILTGLQSVIDNAWTKDSHTRMLALNYMLAQNSVRH